MTTAIVIPNTGAAGGHASADSRSGHTGLDTSASVVLGARLRACRSFLVTPASRPERVISARGSDGIIVDLGSTDCARYFEIGWAE